MAYPDTRTSFTTQVDGGGSGTQYDIEAEDVNKIASEVYGLTGDFYPRGIIPAEYVIFEKDSVYYARACFDGGTHYSDNTPDIGALLNTVVANIGTRRKIEVKGSSFNLATAIDFGNRGIILNCGGLGGAGADEGTRFELTSGFPASYSISYGVSNAITHFPQIHNLTIDGDDRTTALGGLYLRNCWHGDFGKYKRPEPER